MGMRIIPIKVGNEKWGMSYFVDGAPQLPPIDIPHMMFYIDGAEKKILIDCGGRDPESESGKLHSKTYTRAPEEHPDVALKAATGVSPEEIEILILTHLHWDHCGNLHMFPNAQVYVQLEEILDSINPIPRFYKTYESFKYGVVPPYAQQPVKWNFVEGDTELLPGIKLVKIPGHSAGIQGVYVETDKGPYFLGSDAIPLYENIENGEVKTSALCLSLEKAYYSAVKINKMIKDTGMVVLPGHDRRVLDHKCYPFDE
ncbi:MAG: N-acyl homoserine lactonase family protein [Lachnospiraceae bacterium]|nr:N-acyl homoserine lactonase family protein [Lachnospiraceae bacterium]